MPISSQIDNNYENINRPEKLYTSILGHTGLYMNLCSTQSNLTHIKRSNKCRTLRKLNGIINHGNVKPFLHELNAVEKKNLRQKLITSTLQLPLTCNVRKLLPMTGQAKDVGSNNCRRICVVILLLSGTD